MTDKMMKAAVLTEYGSLLEIKQVPIPQPGPTEVLVKMIACGICHTDLHGIRGGK
jgi:propanol-preferring alcohol dehydrogenase